MAALSCFLHDQQFMKKVTCTESCVPVGDLSYLHAFQILQEEMEKKIRQRLLMQRDCQEQMAMKELRKQAEKEEEEAFRKMMLAKFAEDDRIEQMNDRKRRMKQLEHKREVEKLIEDRRRQREADMVQSIPSVCTITSRIRRCCCSLQREVVLVIMTINLNHRVPNFSKNIKHIKCFLQLWCITFDCEVSFTVNDLLWK